MKPAILVVSYDSNWPEKYARESVRILSVVQDFVIDIHHVGSTAIPGCDAKPIIDIAVEGVCYPPTDEVINKLETIGYTHWREAGVQGRHFFAKGVPRSFHLHWCPQGGEVVKRQLQFRDAIRKSPSLIEEYVAIKKAAAKVSDSEGDEYTRLKGPFVAKVLDTA